MVRSQPPKTIAVFAREGGVGVETIRYYQRRGLLQKPARTISPGNSRTRHYGQEDIRRLRFIRNAQSAGFTLEQIAELLSLDATADRARARVLATQRILVLDAKITELKRARDALSSLARRCATSSGPCPIIEAFAKF